MKNNETFFLNNCHTVNLTCTFQSAQSKEPGHTLAAKSGSRGWAARVGCCIRLQEEQTLLL